MASRCSSAGPIGHAVSNDFEKHHCDCANCGARQETSFEAVYLWRVVYQPGTENRGGDFPRPTDPST